VDEWGLVHGKPTRDDLNSPFTASNSGLGTDVGVGVALARAAKARMAVEVAIVMNFMGVRRMNKSLAAIRYRILIIVEIAQAEMDDLSFIMIWTVGSSLMFWAKLTAWPPHVVDVCRRRSRP
jgi:hypothetical protein